MRLLIAECYECIGARCKLPVHDKVRIHGRCLDKECCFETNFTLCREDGVYLITDLLQPAIRWLRDR